jgi:hypothetical protein
MSEQVEVLHHFGQAQAGAAVRTSDGPDAPTTSSPPAEGITMRSPDLPHAPTNVRVVETRPIVVVNGVRSAELEVLPCSPARRLFGAIARAGLAKGNGLSSAVLDGVQITWDTRQVSTDLPILAHRVAQICDGSQAWKLAKVVLSPKKPNVAIVTELKPGVKYAAPSAIPADVDFAASDRLQPATRERCCMPCRQGPLAGARSLCAR